MQKRGGKAIERIFSSARPRNTDPKSSLVKERSQAIEEKRIEREKAQAIPGFCVWSQSQAP